MKKNLMGNWLFRATDESEWKTATVPGCQLLDLIHSGCISDPFVGTNEAEVQWVHDKDFLYKKDFSLTQTELEAERIILVCKQLDTICHLTVNGEPAGTADNCHTEHRFDVKPLLKAGDNEVEITFFSAKKYVEQKYKEQPTPLNPNGQNGIVHIRKPQYHFGWDWGPVLTPAGISGDIYLLLTDSQPLGRLTAKAEKKGESFEITAKAKNAESITLTLPDGGTVTKQGSQAVFTIESPELWWTAELSGTREQPLYAVTAVKNGFAGEAEQHTVRLGLRTIELDRSKDKYGSNFRFILNGVPLFIKGANYIPADSFITRFDSVRLNALLDAVQFSNMNLLRIWGGGYYADDRLLEACDKRGILVWQDFMFACQAYPFFDNGFLNNVLHEVKENAERISTHPCLALWCGNNEIEDMHMSWVHMKKYVDWTEKFFYHILPDALRKYDALTPYTEGSPIGTAHNKNVGADFVGDTHLWGVWHGLQPMNYYRKRMTRFCSEFGFESLPSFKTVKTYAKPQEYDLSGEVQKAHQKCVNGNDKMLYYIASRFRLSNRIEDIIYLSQVTQQECIADATEHWRRNKGRCNGAIYWQLNDCWQTCSWSGYDYFGEYKALQYKARHFNAPLSVSLEDSKKNVKVYIINDLNQAKNVEAEYELFDFVKGTLKTECKAFALAPLENKIAFEIPLTALDKKRNGIAVRLYNGGECINEKTLLLDVEKHLALPKATIEVHEKTVGDKKVISLKSPVFARLVMLENDCSKPFSDNFFDLLPGKEKTVVQPTDSGAGETRIKSVSSLNYDATALETVRARTKVFFSPLNISNALYHGRVPKEYKGTETE